MPTFQWQPYENRSIGAMLQLMQAPAEARARALRAGGEAQARAAEVGGQATAQAAGTIGGIIAGIPRDIQAAKDAEQMRDVRAQQLENAKTEGSVQNAQLVGLQRQQAGQQVLAKAIKQFSDPEAGTLDHKAIASAVSQAGFSDTANAWLKGVTENEENLTKLASSSRALREQQLSTIGDLAYSAQTPDEFTANVALAAAYGLIPEEQAHQLAEQAAGDNWKATRQQYLSYSPRFKTQQAELSKPVKMAPGETLTVPATGEVVATGGPAKAPNSQEAEFLLDGKRIKGDYLPGADGKPGRYFYNGQDVTAKAQGIPPASLLQNSDDAVNLTDAGLDAAAHMYARTGQLPPMGQGRSSAGVRTRIINRAAELYPGLDIATNKAGFAADAGSLATLTKQLDAISAFEGTAQKNIDVFLERAKKVADTGIPLLNRPLRWAAGAGGSADQTAYEAARQVAVSEIAKIVQNPNLTGVLSDSARHEIESFSPTSATLAQTMEVMKLLKRDMDNRKSSLENQRTSIQQRMKDSQAGGAEPKADPLGIR